MKDILTTLIIVLLFLIMGCGDTPEEVRLEVKEPTVIIVPVGECRWYETDKECCERIYLPDMPEQYEQCITPLPSFSSGESAVCITIEVPR